MKTARRKPLAEFRMDPRKMRWNQKITESQKKLLIIWAAGAGENWDKYQVFADKNMIPKFASKNSWANFVQRNRAKVQAARRELVYQVVQDSTMSRKKRIEMLEADANRCEQIIATSGPEGDDSLSVDQLARMMDQKRRTLESIAKEMGEWGVAPDDEGGRGPSNPLIAIAEQYKQIMAAQAAEPAPVTTEGEFRELPA